MYMRVLRNDEIPVDKWIELLKRSPYASPFQTPEFYKLFNSVTGISAQSIGVEEGDELISLIVVTLQKESGLKGLFSKRAIIYGGPLIDHYRPDALEILLKNISCNLPDNPIYIESRNLSDYNSFKDIFIGCGFQYKPWLNFRIETSDPNRVKTNMSSSRLRQIRKAIKTGVKWEEANDINEVKIFYRMLSGLYKKKIARPLLPEEFFLKFFESGLGKYLLVWYNNYIIGGIMCPILKEKAIYELYICGLDEEYKEQYPSVIATWAAIEYAFHSNIPVFDFMGAGSPDEEYGVREFKARFGGDLFEFGRYIRISNPLLYSLGKLGIKASGLFI